MKTTYLTGVKTMKWQYTEKVQGVCCEEGAPEAAARGCEASGAAESAAGGSAPGGVSSASSPSTPGGLQQCVMVNIVSMVSCWDSSREAA